VVNVYFKPTKSFYNIVPKEFSLWTPENKIAHYDVRAKNILAYALTLDEFYRVFVCFSGKEMWDLLEVNHKGIK